LEKGIAAVDGNRGLYALPSELELNRILTIDPLDPYQAKNGSPPIPSTYLPGGS